MKLIISMLFVCLALVVRMAAAENYVIGVEANDYLPYWKAEGAHYTGFGRDFFDEFAAYSGHTFTFTAFPVKRCLNKLLENEVDAKFPDNAYWSQEEKVGHGVIYSEAVVPYTDGLLVLPDRIGKGADKLGIIATMIGFTPWAYIDDINSGRIKLRENTKLTSALKMAIAGRVDGVYFNPVAAKFLLKSKGLGENSLVYDPELPHTDSNYHISTKITPN